MVEADFQERARAIKCLGEFRNLLAMAKDIKIPIHDESFLMRFIRAKKYDVDLAFKTLQNYYKLRDKNPKIFSVAYPTYPTVKECLTTFAVGKLKALDRLGRPVLVLTVNRWKPATLPNAHILAALTLVFDEVHRDENAQRSGITFITDADGLSLEHIKTYGINTILTWVKIFKGSYPLRYKHFLGVNENHFLDFLMIPARAFFSAKMKERVRFLGTNYDEVLKVVAPEGLPKQFGGHLDYEEAFDTEMIDSLMKRDAYYRDLMEYGYNKVDSDENDA